MSEPTDQAAFAAAYAEMMDKKLRAMSDEDFALFLNGAMATLEACQKEFERRATKGQPAGNA